jgi:hypothetical protein
MGGGILEDFPVGRWSEEWGAFLLPPTVRWTPSESRLGFEVTCDSLAHSTGATVKLEQYSVPPSIEDHEGDNEDDKDGDPEHLEDACRGARGSKTTWLTTSASRMRHVGAAPRRHHHHIVRHRQRPRSIFAAIVRAKPWA